MKYEDYLKSKRIKFQSTGFEVDPKDINSKLFDFQRDIVVHALKLGRYAIFADTGLGKTLMQLEWAKHVHIKTKKPVLIIAPLAVSLQTKREGEKFNVEVNVSRSAEDVTNGINITNYEMLHKFDPSKFDGIVLDESSILKSYMGKTKQQLVEWFKNTKYKLACTATPSPNDNMELLNHAEYLGIMRSAEALAIWFINDTMNFGTYRIKGHAQKDYWSWVSSWAVSLSLPSDLGYDDNDFKLPKLNFSEYLIKTDISIETNGNLFRMQNMNATSFHKEKRLTLKDRVIKTSELVNYCGDQFLIWCDTNYEADMLKKYIPEAIEVRGADKISKKEQCAIDFQDGKIRILISKPKIFGFGLNFQNCHNTIFCGLSFSYEMFYQAVRRFHRFGQKKEVNVHVVLGETERQILTVIKKKEFQFNEMKKQMRKYMLINNPFGERKYKMDYKRNEVKTDNYHLICGDAVDEIKTIDSDTVDFTIFSPPFSNYYIYSDSFRDMGNVSDDEEFFKGFGFLIDDLYRITKPGRLCAVHCKQLVDYAGRDGRAGLRDFRGDIIHEFGKRGWKYHSEVCIWKDPVIEMQRTKSTGLLHKTIKRDGSFSRQGLPDYLVVFRKWDEGHKENPIERKRGLDFYIGNDKPNNIRFFNSQYLDYEKKPTLNEDGDFMKNGFIGSDEMQKARMKSEKYESEGYSIEVWQRYASPVWFDISQTNVLNIKQARENEDEKHICPLQLDVIERAIHLWSNEGETVFSPFGGIGSEPYSAIKLKRKAIAIELKERYFEIMADNLNELDQKSKQKTIFELLEN